MEETCLGGENRLGSELSSRPSSSPERPTRGQTSWQGLRCSKHWVSTAVFHRGSVEGRRGEVREGTTREERGAQPISTTFPSCFLQAVETPPPSCVAWKQPSTAHAELKGGRGRGGSLRLLGERLLALCPKLVFIRRLTRLLRAWRSLRGSGSRCCRCSSEGRVSTSLAS